MALLLIGLVLVGLLLWHSWEAQRDAKVAVQEDYQATWCSTFGADLLDQTAFDEWFGFVERNRSFLESGQDFVTVDWESGTPGTVFESDLTRAVEAWEANAPQASGYARTDWDLQREEAVVKFKLDRHNTVGVESAFEEYAVLASIEGLLAIGTDDFGNPIKPVCD